MSGARSLLFRGGSFSRSFDRNPSSSRTTSADPNNGNENELASIHASAMPPVISTPPAVATGATSLSPTPDACEVSGGSPRSGAPYTPYRHQPSPPPYTPYNEHSRPSEPSWSVGTKLSFDSGPQPSCNSTSGRFHQMLYALMQFVMRCAALVWAWFTWAFPP